MIASIFFIALGFLFGPGFCARQIHHDTLCSRPPLRYTTQYCVQADAMLQNGFSNGGATAFHVLDKA
jgi:hypothetical protein